MKSYYDILEVKPNATPEEIGAAYGRASSMYPIKSDEWIAASEAYQKLSHPYSVFSQVELIYKKPFNVLIINLARSCTPITLLTLSQKIEAIEGVWKAEIKFEEYKKFVKRWYFSSRSDAELEADFNQLKSKPIRCDFIIEKFERADSPEVIQFITNQLQLGRVEVLTLQQNFSDESLDTILKACRVNALDSIRFANKNQRVTNQHVQILLECIELYKLKGLYHLPGKEISAEMIEKLAIAIVQKDVGIRVEESPYFNIRRDIETCIHRPPSEIYSSERFGEYSSEDIKRLGTALKKKSSVLEADEKKHQPSGFTFILNSEKPFDNPEWIPFFTDILHSNVNVVELRIEKLVEYNILIAIISALGINTTIQSLTYVSPRLDNKGIEKIDALSEALKSNTTLLSIQLNVLFLEAIFEALLLHPTLTSITFSHGIVDLGNNQFYKLLTKPKSTIRKLTIEGYCDPVAYQSILSGLAINKTLTALYLSQASLQNKDLCQLGRALTYNNTLIEYKHTLDFDFVTADGKNKFLKSLQQNFSLRKIEFRNADEELEKSKGMLKQITVRNNEEWIRKNRQPYVAAVMVLYQAILTKHPFFLKIVSFCFDNIFSFLRPSREDATLKQVNRCTMLTCQNILNRTWNVDFVKQKKDKTKTYPIFKRWKERKPDETYTVLSNEAEAKYPPLEHKGESLPSPDDVTTAGKNLLSPQSDWDDNIISKGEFHRILETYTPHFTFASCCCFFNPLRSRTMRELWKIQADEKDNITRAQIAAAIALDTNAKYRQTFFNNEEMAVKTGTDNVILQLKHALNY